MESQCPICLEDFSEKIRASPDACDHIFCLPCLEKWSKLGSYCPVDRRRYKKILNLDSDVVIQVKQKKGKRKKRRTLYDFSAVCEVCSMDNNADILLLCDCCDLGFHLYCLSPPLKKIPAGLWFCPTCTDIENKIRKRKGIRKEVEADVSFEKEIISDNYNSKTKNEDSKKEQTVSKDNSIVGTFHNIINEFEDISVNRCFSTDAPNSSLLSDSFIKLDKIDKTFHFHSNTSNRKNIKYAKTYSLPSKSKMKTLPIENQMQEILDIKQKMSNADDLCIKEEMSKDLSVLEDCLSQGMHFGYMNSVISLWDSRDTESSPSKKIQESTLQSKTNCENNIEDSPLNLDNLQETCPAAEKGPLTEEIQKVSEPGIAESVEDLLSPCKSTSKQSEKGTYNNLISEFLNETSNQMTKEKIQFSVFDKISSDIDASQKKYSEINSLVNKLFSSKLHVRHCFLCKDMIFVKSQKCCKICKLKYFKKSAKNIEHSKCMQDIRPSSSHTTFGNGHAGNSTALIETQRSAINKCSTNVSERRRRSLIHKLQKIGKSESKFISPSI